MARADVERMEGMMCADGAVGCAENLFGIFVEFGNFPISRIAGGDSSDRTIISPLQEKGYISKDLFPAHKMFASVAPVLLIIGG